MRRILFFLLFCFCQKSFSTTTEMASLQRGARMYVNTCQSCHSLPYERYQTLATDLHIPFAVMQKTLMLNQRIPIRSTMETSLSKEDAQAIFGAIPPDLSHIIRRKGKTFVRDYLKGFYSDPSSPFGSNNIVKPGTAMPDVLSWLRGERVGVDAEGKIGVLLEDHAYLQWYRHPTHMPSKKPIRLITVRRGVLTPSEFDATIEDIVGFLAYVDDPTATKRTHIGIAVIVFLLIWLLFVYGLYRDTVKTQHRNHSH